MGSGFGAMAIVTSLLMFVVVVCIVIYVATTFQED